MLFRTEAQKQDQAWSWRREDRAFFASGACHILAQVFLQMPGNEAFRPWLIQPQPGFRGEHVITVCGDLVFDYHGYSERERYLAHFFGKIRRFFPGWQGQVVKLEDFMTPDFFETRLYRKPEQYFQNPVPRAEAFIQRLESPAGLAIRRCWEERQRRVNGRKDRR